MRERPARCATVALRCHHDATMHKLHLFLIDTVTALESGGFNLPTDPTLRAVLDVVATAVELLVDVDESCSATGGGAPDRT